MMRVDTETLPVLLVDTREQRPLQFVHLHSESATLTTGDYSVKGLEEYFAVERKSLADLAGSLTRERDRFMREMHRLRGFQNAYLLVVGSESDLYTLAAKGRANVKQIQHSLLSVQARYGVHVVWVDSPQEGALLVESWAFCALREALKPAGVRLGFPEWVSDCVRAVVRR